MPKAILAPALMSATLKTPCELLSVTCRQRRLAQAVRRKAWRGAGDCREQRPLDGSLGIAGQQNHRGLPTRRYPVWTVLHTFGFQA
jgi:hypothetical protein